MNDNAARQPAQLGVPTHSTWRADSGDLVSQVCRATASLFPKSCFLQVFFLAFLSYYDKKSYLCHAKDMTDSNRDINKDMPDRRPEESTLGADRPWFVLWVKARAEKSVRDSLIKKGLEAVVATKEEMHTWRRGEKRKVEVVLIPSVVFVRMDKGDRRIVEDQLNVHSVMRDPARKSAGANYWDMLARVTDEEMHIFLQMLGQEEVPVQFASTDYSVGEYVHIKGFKEGHNTAQIVRIYGDTKTYVGLRVSFLGCAYMQMPLNRIEKIADKQE